MEYDRQFFSVKLDHTENVDNVFLLKVYAVTDFSQKPMFLPVAIL